MSERILFLCTGNSCRSQMAEGFANKYLSYKAFSAGTKKSYLDPHALKVMSEIDIDISQHFSKTSNELSSINFKYIFTLCSDAEENCPIIFQRKTIHVSFEDPPHLTRNLKNEVEILDIYRKVRDEIKDFVLNIKIYTS